MKNPKLNILITAVSRKVQLIKNFRQLLRSEYVLVSQTKITEICNDKYKLSKFLDKKDVLVADTYRPEDIQRRKVKYPLFIKPRSGKGSLNTFKIEDERDLEYLINKINKPVIQEFLEGPEYTIDVLADFSGRVLSVVPRERLKVRAGVTDCGITRKNELLMQAGKKICQTLGCIGPINIQGKIFNGKFVVIEINPRFSGGIPLTIASGANFPEMILKLMRGMKVESGIGSFIDGMVMVCHSEPEFNNIGNIAWEQASERTA